MSLIPANKAYAFAHAEGKKRLYEHIKSAAECGDMYYDADCASLAQDTIDELKEAGYKISPAGFHTRISWMHCNNAPNQ